MFSLSPAATWLVIVSISFAIYAIVTHLYIKSLEREVEYLQPPF